jgi:hypothetical protein
MPGRLDQLSFSRPGKEHTDAGQDDHHVNETSHKNTRSTSWFVRFGAKYRWGKEAKKTRNNNEPAMRWTRIRSCFFFHEERAHLLPVSSTGRTRGSLRREIKDQMRKEATKSCKQTLDNSR